MKLNSLCGTQPVLSRVLFVFTISLFLFNSHGVAGVLPIGPEQDSWSDMAFPTGVTGSFNAGILAISASPSNDLELGPEFGPSNNGKHYGTGGTLGGPFSATLSVTGVVVQSDGSVTAGGSLTVTHVGSAPGSIGADYGIGAGAVLLSGTITEVLLDATGDNTLDVLFDVTGGALQNPNPVNGEVFARANYGLLRIAGVTLPSVWTGNFSLNGATIDLLGVPEPSCFLLAASLGMVSMLFRQRS